MLGGVISNAPSLIIGRGGGILEILDKFQGIGIINKSSLFLPGDFDDASITPRIGEVGRSFTKVLAVEVDRLFYEKCFGVDFT